MVSFCGERGIRTPGTSRYNGFQDRRIRPLCHLSSQLLLLLFKECETVCFSVKAVAKLGVLLKSQNLLGKKIRLFFWFCLILLGLRILRFVVSIKYLI